MPSTVTIGFLLFWIGLSAAYLGVLALPTLTKNWKTAFWLLFLSGTAGWIAMIAAAKFFDYGQVWVEMPASWLLVGASTVILSMGLIYDRTKR